MPGIMQLIQARLISISHPQDTYNNVITEGNPIPLLPGVWSSSLHWVCYHFQLADTFRWHIFGSLGSGKRRNSSGPKLIIQDLNIFNKGCALSSAHEHGFRLYCAVRSQYSAGTRAHRLPLTYFGCGVLFEPINGLPLAGCGCLWGHFENLRIWNENETHSVSVWRRCEGVEASQKL